MKISSYSPPTCRFASYLFEDVIKSTCSGYDGTCRYYMGVSPRYEGDCPLRLWNKSAVKYAKEGLEWFNINFACYGPYNILAYKKNRNAR